MKRRLFSLSTLLATLTILAMTGCRNERPEDFYPDNGRGTEIGTSAEGEQDVEIVLDVPEMLQSTSLRSLSHEQESDAKAIRILAFNVPNGANEDEEIFAYEPRIKKGDPTLDADGKYHVTLTLNEGTALQRLVFLANIPGGKLPAAVKEGATKKAVYESLVYDYAPTGWKSNREEKTNPAQGSDYDLIPMWGESRTFTVVAGENTIKDYNYDDGVIRLYRALARVDVGMNFDNNAPESTDPLPETNEGMDKTDNRLFDLTDVYVYHPAKKYRMAGSMAHIGNPGGGKYKATEPTLPTGVEYYTTKEEKELSNHYTIKPEVGRLVRSIYLPEAPVVPSEKISEELNGNTCIVVGGVYKGNNFNPKGKNADKTYYRIDFVSVEKEGNKEKTTRLPILRNHRYRINILKIDGPGHKTPEDAINNTVSDVVYSVSVWDENETSKVVTDGKYWLKLSSDKLKVGRLGGKLPITFETNCEEGWELIVPEKCAPDPDNPNDLIPNPLFTEKEWVQSLQGKNAAKDVDGTKSSDGLKTKPEAVDFQIKSKKQDGNKKEGVFIVQTYGGRLNWTVRVEQSDDFDLVLEIYKDKEMTQQTNFIEVHEEGWSFDKPVTVDGKEYSPKDQGSYTVFYVRALPYGPLEGKDKLKGWDLTVTDSGGNDFKFWSYGGNGYRGPDETKKERGFMKGDFLSFNTYYEGEGYIPLMFKQVGNNLYELAISNDAISSTNDDPFEIRRNKYTFTLTVTDPADETKKESISKSINIVQQEHNIVIYSDPEMKRPLSMDIKDPDLFLMNGSTHELYVKSNIPGVIQLVRQHQDVRLRGSNSQTKDMIPIKNLVGSDQMYQPFAFELTYLQDHYDTPFEAFYFKSNLGYQGSKNFITVTTRDDINAKKKLIDGIAYWSIQTSDPFFQYKYTENYSFNGHKITNAEVFTTQYICSAIQPEANSYVLELGSYGMLIPLSRINSAANTFYEKWEKPYEWDKYIQKGYAGLGGMSKWVDNYRGPTDWNDFMKEENHGLHYLRDDDDVQPEFIWCDVQYNVKDIKRVLYDPESMENSTGPIKMMDIVKIGGERYLSIVPGASTSDNVGNTLVAVRSSIWKKKETGITEVDNGSEADTFSKKANKFGSNAILWSWHIITVPKDTQANKNVGLSPKQEYLTTISPGSYTEKIDGATIESTAPDWLDKELGARRRTSTSGPSGPIGVYKHMAHEQSYEIMGMTYQFGRKDPFPNENYEGKAGYANLKWPYLKSADGTIVHTEFYGDGNNSYRMTYKQSIENPTVAVRTNNTKDEHWMVEGGRQTSDGSNKTQGFYQVSFLWGSSAYAGTPDQRESFIGLTDKTVFDPCPYGFKIPAIGYETAFPLKGTGYLNFLKKLLPNHYQLMASSGAREWSGPSSGKKFVTTMSEVRYHTSTAIYGGQGRSGAYVIKTGTPYFAVAPAPLLDGAPKYALIPIFPIVNEKETDYKDWWEPSVRGFF